MDCDVPEPRSIWDEAKGYVERGDYDKAIDIYKYVMIRYADNIVATEYANAYLGDIYLTHHMMCGKTLFTGPGSPSNPLGPEVRDA